MHLEEFSQNKFALGSDISITIVTTSSDEEINNVFNSLWRFIFDFEKRFSRFLPLSELTIFNKSAGIRTIISSEFRQLLETAKKLSIETDGVFNPFILPALHRAGYIQSAAKGYENDFQEDYSSKKVVTIEHLKIGNDWATIPYGTAIDLGGCGKGYLADRLGEILKKNGVHNYWVSLGGDVITSGIDKNNAQISLNIQDASSPSDVSEWVINCPTSHFSAATSGTFRRQNQTHNDNWHHIIDPKTLKPAITDIKLATVCDKSALRADVFASCAVILGSLEAPLFLEKMGVEAALLQCQDKNGKPYEVRYGDEEVITKSANSRKAQIQNA